MSAVGDIIQPGQSIPDDVSEVKGDDGRTLPVLPGDYAVQRLTVTAVREQPAEPEPQQADVSPLLDLVRQLAGDVRVRMQPDLFDRIAALVPTLPVQARDGDGEPWWIHACGRVVGWKPDGPPPDWACDDDTGPWRALFVGGDPAPDVEVERYQRLLKTQASNFAAATDKLTAERDEARAELKHHLDSVDRLAAERNAALAELDRLKAAQPDPLVLRLPEVPEGAVALVGVESGTRYTPGRASADEGCWYSEKTFMWHGHLGGVLGIEGSVRVEMAPPREPRTWPRLDRAPKDIKAVRGASGRIYRRNVHTATFEAGMVTISHLQELDGPLTEVLADEPGGTASPEVQR